MTIFDEIVKYIKDEPFDALASVAMALFLIIGLPYIGLAAAVIFGC